MLGGKKRKLNLGVKDVRFAFRGFSTDGKNAKGVLSADDCKNCECTDGELRLGVGLKLYYSPAKEDVIFASAIATPERFFMLKKKNGNGYDEKLGYVSPEGVLYLYEHDLGRWVHKHSFRTRMRPIMTIDEKDNPTLLLSGEKGVFTCSYEGTVTQTSITKASCAACFFKGRFFFAQKPFTLFYSKPYTPTDFSQDIDEAGCVRLPSDKGEIVALVPMKDKLYVFYEYGIGQLEISGTARDFVFKKIGYDGGKIHGDTVGVCAVKTEKAFFLAQDGLYAFNGVTAKRVCENLPINPMRVDHVCNYATFEGKYFLTYLEGTLKQKAVVIDAETEKGYFSFKNVGLSTFLGKSYCICDERVQLLIKNGELPKNEEGYFFASGLTFGVSKEKNLKSVTLEGEGEIRLLVSDGNVTQTFDLSLQTGGVECQPTLRGKSFSIKILPSVGAVVRAVSAWAQTLERVR